MGTGTKINKINRENRSIGWSETRIVGIIYNSIHNHKEIRSGAIFICEAWTPPFTHHTLSCLILWVIRDMKLILTRMFSIRFNEGNIDST